MFEVSESSLTEDSSKRVFSGWLFIKTFDFIFLYVFQVAKDSKDLEKLFSDCQEKFHFPLLRRDCYPQQPKLREIHRDLNILPKSLPKFYNKIFICSPFLLSNSTAKQHGQKKTKKKSNIEMSRCSSMLYKMLFETSKSVLFSLITTRDFVLLTLLSILVQFKNVGIKYKITLNNFPRLIENE